MNTRTTPCPGQDQDPLVQLLKVARHRHRAPPMGPALHELRSVPTSHSEVDRSRRGPSAMLSAHVTTRRVPGGATVKVRLDPVVVTIDGRRPAMIAHRAASLSQTHRIGHESGMTGESLEEYVERHVERRDRYWHWHCWHKGLNLQMSGEARTRLGATLALAWAIHKLLLASPSTPPLSRHR